MKKRHQYPFLVFKLLSVSVVLILATAARGQSAISVNQCAALGELALDNTRIISTAIVRQNGFTPPGADKALESPAFCRVIGITQPQIKFEVWLPTQAWNGKYQGVGNGGMAGTLSYGSMAGALRRGYATASTDTGHEAGPIPFDASWANGRADLIADFGHRALHLTTVNGKAVTEALYNQAPSFSYYTGCSKGGQQGFMEAQRYPQDFDGIVAGAPAHDWTNFYAGGHLWISQALLSDPEAFIPEAKLQLLGDAVNQACDAKDGIADGILNDPRDCDFDPLVLACPNNGDAASCLTAKQITAVQKIWSGANNSQGQVYPPLVPGGEAYPGAWRTWVTGREPFTSLHWLGGEGFFRWFVFEDEDWDFNSFDYDSDLQFALEKVGPAVDATNPDLSEFRDQGAKLLVYHGWGDPDISPLSAIEYFEEVLALMAGDQDREQALNEINDFYRLFMVPGMGHCAGGPGPDRFDALTALENWVERGIAPERIIASKIQNGETVRTRPLCLYPKVALWDGQGDTDVAGSFSCRLPERAQPDH